MSRSRFGPVPSSPILIHPICVYLRPLPPSFDFAIPYSPPMRILLTNDDGIHAPGIVSLFDAITDASGNFGAPLSHGGETPGTIPEVLVVAPLTVQSATGHGVTFREPLMTQPAQVTARMSGVAVDGR